MDIDREWKESLVEEIKVLRMVNENLHQQIKTLKMQCYSKNTEVESLRDKNSKLEAKIDYLLSEKKILETKHKNREKRLEAEAKRNDIFSKQVKETSKTRREAMMLQEMDSLRAVNRTLLRFTEILSKTYDFDAEVIQSLASVADGVEDRLVNLFLESIDSKNNIEHDVEMRDVKDSYTAIEK